MTTNAKDKDRALAQNKSGEGVSQDVEMEMDEEGGLDEMANGTGDQGPNGNKVIVIHPGSQNLRIGHASDALPKTVPMVIARKWDWCEAEENGGEPTPKRLKLDDESLPEPEKLFGQEVCYPDELLTLLTII
jgi:actin-related protein 8